MPCAFAAMGKKSFLDGKVPDKEEILPILTAWEMAVPVDQRLLREKKETLIVAAEKQAPPTLENLCLNYEVLKPWPC